MLQRQSIGRGFWYLLMAVLAVAFSGTCACWERGRDGKGMGLERSGVDPRAGDGGMEEVRGSDSLPSGLMRSPGDPGPTDVVFKVHGRREMRAISPYIYGVNIHCDWQGEVSSPGMVRMGGNRWTAYNWTNNASNAGSDFNHQNDGWLGGGDTPGEAVRKGVLAAHEAGAAALVTIPITGRVAADKRGDGDVAKSGEHFLDTRFAASLPRKGGAFSYPPRLQGAVYQDEMIHWLERQCPHDGRGSPPLFYALDNEPALWAVTHPRIRPEPVTYSELIERSILYARAIKDVSPTGLVFGPVSYGWLGFTSLQNASDARGRDFLGAYLSAMRRAGEEDGRRLLDVLTVHWYPEALGGRERITAQSTEPAVVKARVQAPRSLWDPRYMEDSWIARRALWGPIRLLPRLFGRIREHYPGTKLAITEYYYGGGGHISGGIAQADVLGIFGREGVYAAAVWTFGKGDVRYVFGALNMYRDFDGAGGRFGDTSVQATTSDHVRTSVYASIDEEASGRMVILALNKDDEAVEVGLRVTHDIPYEKARVFRLSDGSPEPRAMGSIRPVAENAFRFELPPMTVTTLELRVADGEEL